MDRGESLVENYHKDFNTISNEKFDHDSDAW